MLVRERQCLTNGVIEVIDTNRSEQCPAKPRFDAQHEYLEVRIARHAAHILISTETAEVQSRATFDPRKLRGGEVQPIWMEATISSSAARSCCEVSGKDPVMIMSRVPSTSRIQIFWC
jgi:hypothetical protein